MRTVALLRAHVRTSLAACATWHTPKMLDATTITFAHCAVDVIRCTTPRLVPDDGGEDLHVWPTRLRPSLLVRKRFQLVPRLAIDVRIQPV